MKFTLFKGAFPDMVEEVVSEFEAFDLYQALLHLEEEGYMVDPVHLIRSTVIDGYEYVDFGLLLVLQASLIILLTLYQKFDIIYM